VSTISSIVHAPYSHVADLIRHRLCRCARTGY